MWTSIVGSMVRHLDGQDQDAGRAIAAIEKALGARR